MQSTVLMLPEKPAAQSNRDSVTVCAVRLLDFIRSE